GPVRVAERKRELPGRNFPDVGVPGVVAGDQPAGVGGEAEGAVLLPDRGAFGEWAEGRALCRGDLQYTIVADQGHPGAVRRQGDDLVVALRPAPHEAVPCAPQQVDPANGTDRLPI